jgi:hypothetical protein
MYMIELHLSTLFGKKVMSNIIIMLVLCYIMFAFC